MRHGAIFDMDGLLLDTERTYVTGWRKAAVRFGTASSPEFEQAVAGTNGERMREVIRHFFPQVDAQAFLDTCLTIAADERRNGVRKMPGAEEILRFFRENGVKMALASASDPDTIHENLRRAGLETYFDALVSGEDVPRGKPAPDIFLYAARQLRLSPEDCYVFEDGISGATAGVAAGCATVMIPDLFQPTAELKAGCAGIYNSLILAKEALKAGQI